MRLLKAYFDFDCAFAVNFSPYTRNLLWIPSPIGPASSEAFTVKVNSLPFTSVRTASALTFIPQGVAEMCLTFISVPTVVSSPSRYSARQLHAAFSISIIITGVANTRRLPLPTFTASSLSVTVSSAKPLIPVLISFIATP